MNSYHRFFLSNHQVQLHQTIDLSAISHQLQRVLRLQTGTQIVLLDGAGGAFVAEIVALSSKAALGHILAQLPNPPEPTVHLTLYQCSLKADKFEWVLQKGTELGVSRFVPVISQRSIVRPASALLKKYERWQSIIGEAAEQCGRGRLPELAQPLTWQNAITHAQGIRLLPWEEQSIASVTIRDRLAAPPIDALSNPQPINLLIGPEGGISEDEATTAQAAGWQAVSLGPRILRAETAALAGIVLVMEHARQFH